MLMLHPDKSDPDALAFCRRFLADDHPRRFVLGRNEYAVGIAGVVDVDGFIDDFTSETEFMGRPVLKMAEAPKDCLVVSAVLFVEPLTALRNLQSHHLACLDYFRFLKFSGLPLKPVAYLCDARRDLEKNMGRYQWLYDRMSDQPSRKILESLLNFRCSGDLRYMQDFGPAQDRQYFEDFLDLAPGEVFVDAGGFDGQTTLEFGRRCPEYRKVYFIEPDEGNIRQARSRLAGRRDIVFHAVGLDDGGKVLRFSSGGGSASRISETGHVTIRVDALDHLVGEGVSFIKMDVEGAESAALAGAKNHILNDHPKLAICCYHKCDDLWRIPEQVLAMRNDYALYVRHYTDGMHETVAFFIPEKGNGT